MGSSDVLAQLAVEMGMDDARTREYLAFGEGTREVEADIAAAQRMGITAVPTFVFDGTYGVQGAQAPETFLQALEEAARVSR